MGAVINESDQKYAFRVAYEFLKQHNNILTKPEEYKKLADDMSNAFAQYKDNPLACRLISGVFDYIGSESENAGK